MARNAALIISLVLLLAGCASAPPPQPHVTLQPDGDFWRATWQLATPARELRFDRPATGFRQGAFEVLTPGYAFALDGEHEVLRTDGEPASTIAVRFREFTRHLPKDYEFFQKFSDGSVAIYTGHLLAKQDDVLIRNFRFDASDRPGAGGTAGGAAAPRIAHIVSGGKRHTSPVTWTDDSGEGTYVYFGSIVPVESKDTISIVDPGLPDWLETRTRDALPRLFDLYARRLGAKLPERPTVLFSYKPSEQSGYFSSGGTLPGLIQLGIEGRGWQTESEEGLLQLFHFLAHEAAHLWNGQIVHYPDEAQAWMHEGSADGLAERALLDMRVMNEARFLRYQTDALNQCRRGLGTDPLQTAAKRGRFELYYSCGNALALLTEKTTGRNLFAFWNALIAGALAKPNHNYDVDDYYALLGDGAATVRPFVESPASPDALVAALQSHGIAISTPSTSPSDYSQPLARDALLHLLKEACTGSYGFNTMSNGLAIRPDVNCKGVNGGDVVESIGGHHVFREGHLAWDHVHERCGMSQPVLVEIAGREVTLPCTKPVAARPAYVRIDSR